MPTLDIQFDGTHFHVAVPQDKVQDAGVRFEQGSIPFDEFLDSLCHYWLASGGSVEKLRSFGTAEW